MSKNIAKKLFFIFLLSTFSFIANGATFKAIQSGTVTIPAGDSTVSVTITAVDMGQSFLMFNSSVNGDTPRDVFIAGRLISTTQLDFTRAISTGNAVDISWQVIEYENTGFRVERGKIDMKGKLDSTITLAFSFSNNQKFPLLSFSKEGGAWGNDDGYIAEFPTTNTFRISRNTLTTDHNDVYWQVIRWDVASVQTVSGSLPDGTDSASYTIPTAIDLSKSFLITHQQLDADVQMNDIPTTNFTNANTITATRTDTKGNFTFLHYVVEWPNSTSFGRKACFGTGDAIYDMPICDVNTSKSIIIGGGAMNNIGMSCQNTDNQGSSGFTLNFKDNDKVTMSREVSTSPTSYSFRVINFDTTFTCADSIQQCSISELCNINYPALSVVYSNIIAKINDQKEIELTWFTSEESNHNYFTIETSKDGINFQEVGKVFSNSSKKEHLSQYQFIKRWELEKFLRLKDTDYNGISNYSDLIEVSGTTNEAITIYPNICNTGENINIFTNTDNQYLTLNIYNTTGELVKQKVFQGSQQEKIDTSKLQKGYYLIKITDSNSIYHIAKFMIN